MMKSHLPLLCAFLWASHIAQGFVSPQNQGFRVSTTIKISFDEVSQEEDASSSSARRSIIHSAAAASLTLALGGSNLSVANAAVGTLPEFGDSEAIIQGLTVNVADKSQLDAMVDFLVGGFDFQILRQRIRDTVEEVVGYLLFYASFCHVVSL